MGDDIRIGLERTSPALVTAYSQFGLERAALGQNPLEWTFLLPAAPRPPFCVARREERIIGLSGNIAARIKLGEAEGIAFQAVDSFVSEEARGKRLFSRLAQGFADAAADAGCDVAWGFPNANAAQVAYVLEAMGGAVLGPLLRSEAHHLALEGAEVALAWCFGWSPSYRTYRRSRFWSLPERFRPVEINFGARALSVRGAPAEVREIWYFSDLDSDGI